MNKNNQILDKEQELIEKVEKILEEGENQKVETQSILGFCSHLANTVPQARPEFKQELGNRLVEEMQIWVSGYVDKEKPASASYTWWRDFWRWKYILSGLRLNKEYHWWGYWKLAFKGLLALILLLSILLVIPQTRSVLARWLSYSFNRQEVLLPLVINAVKHDWQSPLTGSENVGYEIYLIEHPKERWKLINKEGFNAPVPGSLIILPDGNSFPIPKDLPERFVWQDLIVMEGDVRQLGFPSLASKSWAGEGPALPPYQLSVNHLIGGDPADRLLILTQIQASPNQGLTFHLFHAGETKFGLVIQSVKEKKGPLFLVGDGELSETIIGDIEAWWYLGTWNAHGEWRSDTEWGNLVWEREGDIFHLAGQSLTQEQLITIALSLPR
jgi:hypothetical protein